MPLGDQLQPGRGGQRVEDLGLGVHDLNTHTLNVYLSNATASASADAVKADLAEITNQNGYDAPEDTTNTASETGGVMTVVGVDVVITATGAVGPFINTVLYNDTPSSPADPLVGWWTRSSVTMADTDTFTIDFTGDVLLTIT